MSSSREARDAMIRAKGMQPQRINSRADYERARFDGDTAQTTHRQRVLQGGIDRALEALRGKSSKGVERGGIDRALEALRGKSSKGVERDG